jgi:hypothetical protein
MKKYKETELYPPVKRFFEELGYTVHAEVLGCDVTMAKDGNLVAVELKTGFNVTLLYQAMERQKATAQVYAAVPRPRRHGGRDYRGMVHICEKLGIGLITVGLDSPARPVQIVVFPPPVPGGANPVKRGGILKEMAGRTKNVNTGGSRGEKIMTAYREKALRIACELLLDGAMTPKLLREKGCDAKTGDILKRNYYGWFAPGGEGAFALTEEGRAAIGAHKEVAGYYLEKAQSRRFSGEPPGGAAAGRPV